METDRGDEPGGGAAGTVKFTIQKKDITITAKDQSVKWGGALATGTDMVSVTGGLGSGQSLSSINLGLEDGTDTNTVGEYGSKIKPSGAFIADGSDHNVNRADNYNISYVNGKLTVTKIKAKVTTQPVAKSDLIYTGASQDLITAGAADTAMEYSFGSDATANVKHFFTLLANLPYHPHATSVPDTGWSEDIPSKTNADT